MAYFTRDGNLSKSFDQPFCSAGLTRETPSQLICLVVLNVVLSVTTFLGNTLILIALHKESSLNPATKLMFRCLAITDLFVGLITEPVVVVNWISVVNERWDICRYTFLSSVITCYIFSSVSLLTSTAVSVDRLLALLLGLRYRQVVTKKRTYITLSVFWVLSIVGTTLFFWNYLITVWLSYTGIVLCLVTSVFSYTKIFLTLRHHQTQVLDHLHQKQRSQANPLNLARYRKAVSSALWLQLTLLVCYLPFGVIDALMNHVRLSPSILIARKFTATLVLLNSSLNPILYCWKIREVRRAVKDTVRQFCC